MINISNLYIQYGDRILLDRISISIMPGDRVGLIGRNGAGKSTLLKVIAGEQKADEGSIARPSGSSIGYLHQEMNLVKGRTVLDEALLAFEETRRIEQRLHDITVELGERDDYESDAYSQLLQEMSDLNDRFHLLGGDTMQAETEKVLKGLGFGQEDFQRQTSEFSGGWQMRVILAKMLLSRPDFLLLDEPTNHLDIESIIWLEGYLQQYAGAIITISHDKTFLDNVTNRTVEIELGRIYDFKLPYSKYMVHKAERREQMESAFRNQQRVIADRERTINRFMAKATKTKMAQSMQKQLDKMERIEIADEDSSAMRLYFPPAPRSGEVVVEAKSVVKNYGALRVLSGADLQVIRGERLAFVGQNGQGKTTLSKILIGLETATAGDVKLGHNVQIGYYAQNQSDALPSDQTLLQTMEQHSPPEMRTRLRSILGAFMFSGEDVDKKVSVLSGGERARLALACLLLRPFNLLVLDEPTNHLDMLSKEVLKEAVLRYDGTLIVVSHDRDFLEGLTDRVVEFRDHRLHNYIGDIKVFLEQRQAADMREVEKRSKKGNDKGKEQGPRPLSKEEQQERKRLQRDVQNAERDIERLEAELKQMEAQMAKPDFYASAEAEKVNAHYQTAKNKLEEAMSRWEEAQMALEAAD